MLSSSILLKPLSAVIIGRLKYSLVAAIKLSGNLILYLRRSLITFSLMSSFKSIIIQSSIKD